MKYFLFISLFCYLVGTLQAIFLLIRQEPWVYRYIIWLLSLGFITHTASIVAQGIQSQRCPLVTYQEFCSFLGWAVMAYYLFVYFLYRKPQALTSFVMPVVLILAIAAVILPTENNLSTLFHLENSSSLLAIHASLFIFSYGAFVITFLAGLMYIIQERELKLKRFGSIFYKLPSLDTCDKLSHKLLWIGFTLLTCGIVTGIISSKHRDGIYWHGDPSEFTTLGTWIIYLLMAHCRLVIGWRGRRAAVLSILGFIMVLFSLTVTGYLSKFHFR